MGLETELPLSRSDGKGATGRRSAKDFRIHPEHRILRTSPRRFFRLCSDNAELRLEITAQRSSFRQKSGKKAINSHVIARNLYRPRGGIHHGVLCGSIIDPRARKLRTGSDNTPTRRPNGMDPLESDHTRSGLSVSPHLDHLLRY